MIINPYMFSVAYDTDALAYFTANTSITSSADKSAINDFYLGLKSDGVYTSIGAMYLPIWGSTNSKWNLITPVDNDASFRLTFTGGLTYASTGITPNGTTGYANTHYNVNTNGSINSCHLSFYSRTSIDVSSSEEMGCLTDASTRHEFSINSVGTAYLTLNANNSYATYGPTSLSTKLYIGTRTASNLTTIYRDGTSIASSTNASTSKPSYDIYIFGRNLAGTANSFSTKQGSFMSIGLGLDSTKALALNNRVTTLLTYFGINV